MVKITKDEINHVATLSRLEFGEDEIDKFTEQMGDIINMAHQLAEVDTEGVPETVQVVDRETDFREDKPEKADGFIKVPVIIDKDDNE